MLVAPSPWIAQDWSKFQTHCPLASHCSHLPVYASYRVCLLVKFHQNCHPKMSGPIPPELRAVLQPLPDLSVSEFLQFPLPYQTQIHTPDILLYWCKAEPNVIVTQIEDLKDHPIPSKIVLSKLAKQSSLLESSKSICYSHLPLSQHFHFPLWVLTYWIEVSQLQHHVQQPWANAELYLAVHCKQWKLPNIWTLCDTAQIALLSLPWAGNVCGFEEAEPRMKLATYLSQKWLATLHIDQQLDLLQIDVECSGQLKCEVVWQSFFHKILELYCDCEMKPYNAQTSGTWHLWTIGEEIASRDTNKLCGVVNIKNLHWVGVVHQENPRSTYSPWSLLNHLLFYLLWK